VFKAMRDNRVIPSFQKLMFCRVPASIIKLMEAESEFRGWNKISDLSIVNTSGQDYLPPDEFFRGMQKATRLMHLYLRNLLADSFLQLNKFTLSHCFHLKSLKIKYMIMIKRNDLTSDDVFCALIQIFHNNPYLEVLHLSWEPKNACDELVEKFCNALRELKEIRIGTSNEKLKQKLCESLASSTMLKTFIVDYNFDANQCSEQHLTHLFKQNKHIESFKSRISLQSDSQVKFFDFLHNYSLTTLELCNTNFAGPMKKKDISRFFNQILQLNLNSTLTSLSLTQCFLCIYALELLFGALQHNTTLIRLNLINNTSHKAHIKRITLIDFFQNNHTLLHLSMSLNKTTADNVQMIAQWLKNNKGLQTLSLKNIQMITQSLKDNKGLQTLSLENICEITESFVNQFTENLQPNKTLRKIEIECVDAPPMLPIYREFNVHQSK
jgi:hypothetical protein